MYGKEGGMEERKGGWEFWTEGGKEVMDNKEERKEGKKEASYGRQEGRKLWAEERRNLWTERREGRKGGRMEERMEVMDGRKEGSYER